MTEPERWRNKAVMRSCQLNSPGAAYSSDRFYQQTTSAFSSRLQPHLDIDSCFLLQLCAFFYLMSSCFTLHLITSGARKYAIILLVVLFALVSPFRQL